MASVRPIALCSPQWTRSVLSSRIDLMPKIRKLPIEHVQKFLDRFANCDWGSVSKAQAQKNNSSIRKKPTRNVRGWSEPTERVFAEYPSGVRGNPILILRFPESTTFIGFEDEFGELDEKTP